MGRKVVQPADAVANYLKGMQGAGDKYKKGIQGVTVNPMQLAATPEATQRYVDGVTASVSSGRRAAALNAVPLSRWQNNAMNVGASRLASGAQKATDKVAAHFQKWGPIQQNISDTVNAMPKGGLANAQARSAASIAMSMQAAGTA